MSFVSLKHNIKFKQLSYSTTYFVYRERKKNDKGQTASTRSVATGQGWPNYRTGVAKL